MLINVRLLLFKCYLSRRRVLLHFLHELAFLLFLFVGFFRFLFFVFVHNYCDNGTVDNDGFAGGTPVVGAPSGGTTGAPP